MTNDLQCALIALSYYRSRWPVAIRVHRRTGKKRKPTLDLTARRDHVRSARAWIRRARALGFRGSVQEQLVSRPDDWRSYTV